METSGSAFVVSVVVVIVVDSVDGGAVSVVDTVSVDGSGGTGIASGGVGTGTSDPPRGILRHPETMLLLVRKAGFPFGCRPSRFDPLAKTLASAETE